MFRIYQNPTNNNFNIETIERGKLILLNQLGQTVFTSSIEKNKTTISTSAFSRGIYIIQFITDKNIFTQKIILQ